MSNWLLGISMLEILDLHEKLCDQVCPYVEVSVGHVQRYFMSF